MDIIFGTDGWRGIINKEINFDTIKLVAQAFADYLKEREGHKDISVAIGFDGRFLSNEFAETFAKVLLANGINTFLSDRVTPTPVLSFFVKKKSLNAGVMITASHNPPEYNGIKFKNFYGGPFFTEETLKVEKLLGKSEIKISENAVKKYNLLLDYLKHIYSSFDFQSIKKANLNILIDSMSGAGQNILQRMFSKYKIKSNTIYPFVDVNFSGRQAEPIEKNLGPLKEELLKGDYSIGLATDGDADRLGVMLENGEWLSAQETILLITDYLVNTKKESGNIVKTSSVTDKLIAYFQNENRKVFDVQVGFKYICEKMLEEDVLAGFEESGGFGFRSNIPERDGIYSALLFVEMLAKSGFNNISELLKEKRKIFGEIFYKRIDLPYHKDDRLDKLPKLFNENFIPPTNFAIKSKNPFYSSRGVINGLKIVFEGKSRWLLIRSSETEPMFRVYAEAESSEEVENLLLFGQKILE